MEKTINIKASYLKFIIDERNEAQAKVKELKTINTILQGLAPNKPLKKPLTSIEKRFQEEMIDRLDNLY